MHKHWQYAIIFTLLLQPLVTSANGVSSDLPQQCREQFSEKNYEHAFPTCRMAAEGGDELSQFSIAFMYSYGKGIARNKVEALAWYERAAEQGHASSQLTVGNIYYNGANGVAVDKAKAFEWYLRAAEQGRASAQFRTGFMYYKGEGVEQDKREAANWIRLAAEQGDSNAQDVLGAMYDNGDGVVLDKREAAKWYRLASGDTRQEEGGMTAGDLHSAIKPKREVSSAAAEVAKKQADLYGIVYHAKQH